ITLLAQHRVGEADGMQSYLQTPPQRAATIPPFAMTDTLRIAVLGAGNWARSAHIPGWQRDPRCKVIAICDVERSRAEAHAAQFDIPEATDDWQATVSRTDIDVVDIVTPSQTHYELATAAIDSGKHVLCEKPVAYDFRQTRFLAEVSRRKRLKTKLGF